VRAGEVQVIAEEVNEERSRFDFRFTRDTIDCHVYRRLRRTLRKRIRHSAHAPFNLWVCHRSILKRSRVVDAIIVTIHTVIDNQSQSSLHNVRQLYKLTEDW
jgi:hypothetical protein